MRMWVDCSEPCRAETLQGFARTFAAAGVKPEQLQVCYAMAETVFAVTQTTPGVQPTVLCVDPEMRRSEKRIVVAATVPQETFLSVGRPVAGLQIRIVDEAGVALADDRVGVVSIAGDCLFSGYYKLEAETQRKLRDGWYHTGDLGFMHAGELFITGRANDLIIVHGKNFHAHELEYLVNAVPGVHPGRNVAVGWFRPEVGSEEVVIIAEVSPGAGVDRRALAQSIKQQVLDQTALTVFDVHVVNPGWLVKTTSGKISRGENLARYLADVGRAAAA
jgi:fatty-acyl-CoA synthase